MQIIYDFQEDFKSVQTGVFIKSENGILSIREEPLVAMVEVVEDVKTLRISERTEKASGVYIYLSKIPGLLAGDRITVTGRVKDSNMLGKTWGIALIKVIESGEVRESPPFAQHNTPDSVFALSHVLEEHEIAKTLTVHTIGWGVLSPLMDFYIDSILITRFEKVTDVKLDLRTAVYSLSEDENVVKLGVGDEETVDDEIRFVVRKGNPAVRVFKRGDTNALHISNRFNHWDGVDINIARMNLKTGNQYKITVHGRVDGDVPEGATMMLQGVPGYVWKSNIEISKDAEFKLKHTLTQSEVEKWTAVRVTSNTPGSSVSFYIYSIDVVRV